MQNFFFATMRFMGRESEAQRIQIEALEAMAAFLRDSLSSLDKAIEFSRRNGITTVEVRQLPKGKKAFEDMLHFTSLLNNSVVKQMLPNAPKQKPSLEQISEQITKRRISKGVEPEK